MPSGFKENAEDLNTADSVQVDRYAVRVEPAELAAIRERTASDFVTDPASVCGELAAELMQARLDRRALLAALDVELDEYATAAPEMPRPPAEEAQERVSGPERRETRTGVSETLSEAQAIESGRQIAVSMMDRAEAKYRHEHGQPHIREHCEACAEEYWRARLLPVHYREAAASLRTIAAANRDVQSEAYINGIESAAGRLDSVARDLDDEAPSLPVPSTEEARDER